MVLSFTGCHISVIRSTFTKKLSTKTKWPNLPKIEIIKIINKYRNNRPTINKNYKSWSNITLNRIFISFICSFTIINSIFFTNLGSPAWASREDALLVWVKWSAVFVDERKRKKIQSFWWPQKLKGDPKSLHLSSASVKKPWDLNTPMRNIKPIKKTHTQSPLRATDSM